VSGIAPVWAEAFHKLSRIPALAPREATGRLYRTWLHAELYHVYSLRRLAEKLQTAG